MPISFTDKYNIDKEEFSSTGAFDVILDVDSRVFIDPALLDKCIEPEFVGCKNKVEKYFTNIITLLSCSKSRGDRFWKKADELLTFKEIAGTCFGYSKGTDGNAIGPVYRQMILQSMHELIEAGEKDPTIFELLGVFEEGIGCDRISDLLTFILLPEILIYTQRILFKFGLDTHTVSYNRIEYKTAINDYNGSSIKLLPKSILSPLPIAESFDDIDLICQENERIRQEINEYINFGRREKLSKGEIFALMKSSVSFRKGLLSAYKNIPCLSYDFNQDPIGEYAWYNSAREYVSKYPLVLDTTVLVADEGIFNIVRLICEQFKRLIEDNGLNELLYNDKKQPKHERAAQLLFFGIADAYCNTNNIDLTRECNSGRGSVDFKLSKGAKEKVIVEVKLTSNSQLKHGIEVQLPIYMQQEKTLKAIYLIIDNGHSKALEKFVDFYSKLDINDKDKIPYYVIDATSKDSASIA